MNPTNRTEVVTRIVFYGRMIKALQDRDAELRQWLADEARAELAEHGTASTWRVPDVATVPVSVTHQTVYVDDEPAFRAWVEALYPTEVYTVRAVRPAWRAGFLERVIVERGPDGQRIVIDPDTGATVPGVAVRPGGEFAGVSVRTTSAAREVFDALAADRLARLELEATTPVVMAEVSDG